jgi:hypothetical protein
MFPRYFSLILVVFTALTVKHCQADEDDHIDNLRLCAQELADTNVRCQAIAADGWQEQAGCMLVKMNREKAYTTSVAVARLQFIADCVQGGDDETREHSNQKANQCNNLPSPFIKSDEQSENDNDLGNRNRWQSVIAYRKCRKEEHSLINQCYAYEKCIPSAKRCTESLIRSDIFQNLLSELNTLRRASNQCRDGRV